MRQGYLENKANRGSGLPNIFKPRNNKLVGEFSRTGRLESGYTLLEGTVGKTSNLIRQVLK